jgi:hypothetical protein
MAESTELATSKIVTRDGIVTATVLDVVSPDRIALMLIKGSSAAQYARTIDDTAIVSRAIKSLLVVPMSGL